VAHATLRVSANLSGEQMGAIQISCAMMQSSLMCGRHSAHAQDLFV
jgi:hypothetical protein